MIRQITNKLTQRPSYFRWSNERLAEYFGCSERTIRQIKTSLKSVNAKYERSLAN